MPFLALQGLQICGHFVDCQKGWIRFDKNIIRICSPKILIDKLLSKQEGVVSASTSYGAQKVALEYDENKISLEKIDAFVNKLGYHREMHTSNLKIYLLSVTELPVLVLLKLKIILYYTNGIWLSKTMCLSQKSCRSHSKESIPLITKHYFQWIMLKIWSHSHSGMWFYPRQTS